MKQKQKKSENDQLAGHFQRQLVIFRVIFVLFFNTIFKYFFIFLKIWTGQSLLTVSLSKILRQNLKNISFQRNKLYVE